MLTPLVSLAAHCENATHFGDAAARLSERLLEFFLSYNLHLPSADTPVRASVASAAAPGAQHPENPLLQAFVQAGAVHAGAVTTTLLHMLNRGADPVHAYRKDSLAGVTGPSTPTASTSTAVRHSLWKLFADLYACEQTNDLLYSNDLSVLIQVAFRLLADSAPPQPVLIWIQFKQYIS